MGVMNRQTTYNMMERCKQYIVDLKENDNGNVYRGWVKSEGDAIIDWLAEEQERMDLE